MVEKLKLWFKKNWFMSIFILSSIIFLVCTGTAGIIFVSLWLLFSVGYTGYKWFNNHKIINK
jgi:hypothetical protein